MALNYLRGWCIIDLLSTFPLYLITNSGYNMLKLVRLPRIYKLAKVFRLLKLNKLMIMERIFFIMKLNVDYILIVKFILLTLVILHISGCLWFFTGTLSSDYDNWIV
jgi:hyperpolarization activated cyclic nucleotide-gated potassium channel 1